MLLINGAIAVLNGMLVTTCRILCCLRGGVFCDGVCRCDPDEGECCGDEWYTDPGECCDQQWIDEDGEVEGLEGEWVCCDDSNGTVTFRILAPADPGCGGLFGRCCTDGNCTVVPPEECFGEVLSGSCARFGCPKSCCDEDADGLVTCETVDELLCTGVVDAEPCETACKGTCCGTGSSDEKTGEPTGEPVTQAECEELGGCWQGIGTVECEVPLDGGCRAPFDEDCCESVVSSAELLTFTGPRKRRCPELTCDVRATVEVTTGSPVYIHGGLFGAPYEACTDEVTFVLCNDQFHVTPAPCSGNLQGLNIKTCWGDADGASVISELLRFRSCQDITHLIGNCDCDCVTTVLYEEEGCTSNAAFVMRGNATIDASGTGALVLTGNITHELDCERTLTLTGSNQGNNELSGAIQSGGGGTSVFKTGVGLWRLSGNSGYTGRLSVLDGTLVMGTSVGSSGESPFGAEDSPEPIIGNSAAGATGTALLLVAAGNSIERGFSVAALDGGGANQVVVLGATGTGSGQIGTNSASIRLNRPAITLQAADTATAVFVGNWRDGSGNANPTVAYTIGTLGNAGVVVLESVLSGSATSVNIVNGTARLQVSIDDGINSATPVTIGSGLGAAIFDINGQSQTLSDIAFVVGSGSITSGTLRLTGTVAATGTGHTISSAVALDAAVTFSGSGELTISGVVSGSESLTYSGDGTLTLSGANTYTGGTTINYGTATAGSLTAFGTGSITVNAGGTLNKGGFALANSITNNGGTVIN